MVPQFLSGGEIPDIFALCRKLERERDEAREQEQIHYDNFVALQREVRGEI